MNVRAVFMGELGILSLFDLTHLLMLNGATGTLHVESNGKRGSLGFDRGQIANAVAELLHEGDEAAHRIFAWKAGTFEFRVGPPIGTRTIHGSTESLMFEAARRMDEAGVSNSGGSVTQALRAHVDRLGALREAFQRASLGARTRGTEAAAHAHTDFIAPILTGDESALNEILDLPAGLVLVGAPSIRAAEELLRSVLVRVLERRSARIVLTAESEAWPVEEAPAALVITPRVELGETLERFKPDVAAFDVAHADASMEALRRAPLVMCAVVAPNAASLMPRWLVRHGLAAGHSGTVPLAGADVGVVFTRATRKDGGPLAVVAARVLIGGEGTRRIVRDRTRARAAGHAAVRSVIEQLRRELRDAA